MTVSTPTTQRYVFLDVLRALAILWMIQVHITNVIAEPSLRHGFWGNLLFLSNGFVAPTFILCAGIGLAIALSRKGALFLRADRSLWIYLRRLAFILFLAYLLHIPAYSLTAFKYVQPERFITWIKFDVLHTIVLGSVLVLGLFFILRTVNRVAVAAAVITVLIFTFTALIWKFTNTLNPLSLPSLAFSKSAISTFPLIPWVGYLFAGFAVGTLFFSASNKTLLANWFIVAGVVVPPVVFTIKSLPFSTPWDTFWWNSSPGVHAFRLSCILCMFGLLYRANNVLGRSRTGVILQQIGNESLFIYVAHLLVVYSTVTPHIIRSLNLANSSFPTILVAWVALTIPMVGLSLLWHYYKVRFPKYVTGTIAGFMLLVFAVFLIR